ncbi:MAG: hypothetical protein ACSHYF_10260 [Verrucomicrobiaceae bacterium]
MAKSIIAVLVASVIVFIWGMTSWGFLGWHQPAAFENEAEVAAVLKKNTTEHAVYAYPQWSNDPDYDTAGKATEGPFIYATVAPDGVPMGAGSTFVIGFLINVLGSTILLVLMQNSRQQSFPGRLSIALLAGLFLGVVSGANPWNWIALPGLETVGHIFDGIIPWTLAGAAMAAILPEEATSA